MICYVLGKTTYDYRRGTLLPISRHFLSKWSDKTRLIVTFCDNCLFNIAFNINFALKVSQKRWKMYISEDRFTHLVKYQLAESRLKHPAQDKYFTLYHKIYISCHTWWGNSREDNLVLTNESDIIKVYKVIIKMFPRFGPFGTNDYKLSFRAGFWPVLSII